MNIIKKECLNTQLDCFHSFKMDCVTCYNEIRKPVRTFVGRKLTFPVLCIEKNSSGLKVDINKFLTCFKSIVLFLSTCMCNVLIHYSCGYYHC